MEDEKDKLSQNEFLRTSFIAKAYNQEFEKELNLTHPGGNKDIMRYECSGKSNNGYTFTYLVNNSKDYTYREIGQYAKSS